MMVLTVEGVAKASLFAQSAQAVPYHPWPAVVQRACSRMVVEILVVAIRATAARLLSRRLSRLAFVVVVHAVPSPTRMAAVR